MGVDEVISNEPVLRAPDPIAPGRVAVVTGAASGIGFGLAERFAAEGMRVVMAERGLQARMTSDNRHGSVLRRGEEIVAGGPPTAPVDFV
jgi:NAD(P)-dependent dehydrogenase (short-subunit alcohol dehydrogenase family)